MIQTTYLWSLLCANLLDDELLVRGNISKELGDSPVITDPKLVRGPGDESLVVRDTVWSADVQYSRSMTDEITPPLKALTAAIKASIPSISK
jgi:hypothetical protein